MTINELADLLSGNDRYGEFLDDLDDHDYPQPGADGDTECNDQFVYFWRRVADGDDIDLTDYVE